MKHSAIIQTYSNITLRGPDQSEVVEALHRDKVSGYVSPTQNGMTVVFEDLSTGSHAGLLSRFNAGASLAEKWSGQFQCTTVAIQACREDFLWLDLFECGTKTLEYDSSSRKAGGAARLARAFDVIGSLPLVWLVMKWPRSNFITETQRHRALARILNCPAWCVEASCQSIREGDLPDGLDRRDLKWVAGDQGGPNPGHPGKTRLDPVSQSQSAKERFL